MIEWLVYFKSKLLPHPPPTHAKRFDSPSSSTNPAHKQHFFFFFINIEAIILKFSYVESRSIGNSASATLT